MRITLLAVGRAKGDATATLFDGYAKRLRWPLRLQEVEERNPLPTEQRKAREGERLLAVTTVCFDIAGLELFLPLTRGGEVQLCPTAVARDGQRLKAEIARLRPTVMQATPSTWTMLFHAGWRNAEGVKVLCGGEALPARLKRLVHLRTAMLVGCPS